MSGQYRQREGRGGEERVGVSGVRGLFCENLLRGNAGLEMLAWKCWRIHQVPWKWCQEAQFGASLLHALGIGMTGVHEEPPKVASAPLCD